MWVHDVLVLSHLIALLPFVHAILLRRPDWIVMVATATIASCFMHISETKHGLDPGPQWRRHASRLLNLDRAIAVSTGFFFGVSWILSPTKSMMTLLVVSVSGIASAVGELQTNAIAYTVLHVLWHLGAFGGIYLAMLDIQG